VSLTQFIVLFIGTLNKQLAICKVDAQGNVLGGQPGCYNLIPVFDWIRRCIVSIFLVFFIAFLPLFLQGTYCSVNWDRILSCFQNWLNEAPGRLSFVLQNISCLYHQFSKSSPPRFTHRQFGVTCHLEALGILPPAVVLRQLEYSSASFIPGSLAPAFIWGCGISCCYYTPPCLSTYHISFISGFRYFRYALRLSSSIPTNFPSPTSL
jgi:hypothetical protein